VRALVTGAGGFVGAHLCARLAADGWDVVGTVRPGAPAPRLAALGVEAELLPVDLTDPVALADGARRADPDVVFHLPPPARRRPRPSGSPPWR
jgi:nucleoside-diphosphate-sugar epimerase